jgi:hypothetical protein
VWPIKPSLITLRACADLDWKVTVYCPKCLVATTLHGEKMGKGKLANVPIETLFKRQAFKCYKIRYGCSGTPASRVQVDAMDVGVSRSVAEWEK